MIRVCGICWLRWFLVVFRMFSFWECICGRILCVGCSFRIRVSCGYLWLRRWFFIWMWFWWFVVLVEWVVVRMFDVVFICCLCCMFISIEWRSVVGEECLEVVVVYILLIWVVVRWYLVGLGRLLGVFCVCFC